MTLFTNTDFRASLSWRGRFAGIASAVNCYLNAVPYYGRGVDCEGGWGVNTFYAVNPALSGFMIG